jgi:hypothetical protein
MEVGNMDDAVKKFWENEFGNNEIGYDFTGQEIRKGAYGQRGSRYGWNMDHILPKSMGGTDAYSNLQITHIATNEERGNRNCFWIDGTLYQVKKITRLSNDDGVADYHYNGKKYCIVILEEETEDDEEYEYSNNGYWDDD